MKIKSFLNRILLLIIIAFAGFIFWLGWEQLELSENTYAAVFTKTSGWKDKIISTDGFNWSFEKVIPTNYTIHKFKIDSIKFSYSENGELPSAKLYSEFTAIPPENFSYNYSLVGSFKFDPNYLLSMLKDGSFDQESFIQWQTEKTLEIQNVLKTFILTKIKDNQLLTLEGAASSLLIDKYIFLDFSEISINMNNPDMQLYTLSKNRYIQNFEAQSKADEKYLVEALKQKNDEQLRLNLLKQYGEVFTKYPIMIEYLKIDQGKLLDRASLDDFISSQNQK